MTGSIFKRKLQNGISWGYVFFGGWDKSGKRIQVFKSGFATKETASKAVRIAIERYEVESGKVSREVGPNGRGVWGYSVGDAHESGFSTRRLAELALRETVERRADNIFVEKQRKAQEAADKAGPTFAKFFEHWHKEHASRRCAPKTLERYGDLGGYLVRELGEIRLNEFTTSRIQTAIHRFQDHGGQKTKSAPMGRPLAPKTVRHIGTLLYTVLSDADRLGILTIPHPMANKRVRLPKLVKRKLPVLDEDNLRILFERARGTRLYPFVVLAAATGCRRGELLALEWLDVDLDTGLLTVSKSLEQTKGGLRVKTPKSGETRRVGVPGWALDVLKDHRSAQDTDRRMFGSAYNDANLIFCQPDGYYYSPDRMGGRVTELMRKAGLHGVTLHSLRHSHASILLSKGVPAAVVSERLGHADQNITLAIYSHALPADSRAAAKIWNDSMTEVIRSERMAAKIPRAC